MFDPQVYFDKAMENGKLPDDVLALAKASIAYDIYTAVNAAYMAGYNAKEGEAQAIMTGAKIGGKVELLEQMREADVTLVPHDHGYIGHDSGSAIVFQCESAAGVISHFDVKEGL